ncbi:MAG: ATP-binding protein [Acetobacteraceae bacterium]
MVARRSCTSGEPGIGKSRLLAALEERLAGEPHASLRYFCSSLHQERTLHPIVARWEQEAGFARGDSPEERLRKLEEVVAPAGLSPEDVALIAGMLSVPTDGRYLQLELNPQRRKERTFGALLRRLERLTQSHPVLMLFEDAQWADPSSLELLDTLIDRLAEVPILPVISFRADFTAPWIGRTGVSLIALSRLNRRDSEMLAAQVSAERALTREVLERIVTQTDGVPLFIEELTKAVLETPADLATAALPLAVPATLYASLMARLDRLPTARQVAQIGAVIGREFPHALLASAASLSQEQLARGLDELIASGLIARRGAPPDAVYTFNHALTRDVAYSSLLRSRRQICHQCIATALASGV